jgi:hypothetical protein
MSNRKTRQPSQTGASSKPDSEVVLPSLPAPTETLALIQAIQDMRQTPLLTFVSCPDVAIRSDVIEQVYEQLRTIGKERQIDVFLYSAGGQTEIPWRLITLIRDFCDRFAVLIPGMALSAATHLALGADEIVMGPLSELSPVDPARAHPLLPSKRDGESPLMISVQDLRHCVEFIKQEITEPTPEALSALFVALFDKVHPLAIGAIQQSYALSRLITEKALSTHMNLESDKECIQQIVETFSNGFFSHDYRIGWREAQALGLSVTYAEEGLWEAMYALYCDYKAFFAVAREIDQNSLGRPLVWLDTAKQRLILERIERKSGSKTEVLGRWAAYPWVEPAVV